ncbi:MAG: large conductance mechanosensitive channel protein MscL [Rhizobiales bacterium]|nr:large conductance mechanosensitive channel protein MscL [Hyphomicrobiales bacterium]
MLKEFQKFALRGNVLDMAVGIIIGAAFTTIVQSLVNDVLMPPIGVLLGGVDFSNYFLTLSMADAPTSLAAAKEAGIPVLAYGKFINAVINFLIVAFAVFMMIRQMNKVQARFEKAKEIEPPAAPAADILLLTEIRDLLAKR